MRKLTEENKQLATNLKREIDEMNPRAAAKSAKSAKKKTAGSDLSSTRGSEERQSLPPGRGQKRGRDNEIEKVRSSISSNFPPSSISSTGVMLSKKTLESMESREASSSPSRQHSRIILHLSNLPTQLPPSANNAVEQQAKAFHKQIPDAPVTTISATHPSNGTPTCSVSAKPKASERDIDLNFWAEEAALLDMNFSYGSTKLVIARPKAPLKSINTLKVNIRSKKRVRSEKYVPLDQVSESALANRVSKMLRHKAKTIGDGLDPPWPNERPKGPQRHHKWTHTLHVDSHNHAKLAFYAEISPTDNPVIAGFPPENAPRDLVRKPAVSSPLSKKRKARTGPRGDAFYHAEEPAAKRRRTGSPSISDDPQQDLALDNTQFDDKEARADDRDTEDIKQDRSHPWEDVEQAKDISQGFQSLKQQLSVQDSSDETNSELEQEENFHARPAVKIEVPDHLKAILVDDWENVTKNLSLVPIPADHPVSEILSTYFEEEKGKRRLGSAEADLLEEVVQGTKDYFEQCLGKLLLYRFEREQYFRLHQAMEKGKDEFEGRPLKDKKISDIYGAEHLCRLFGKFRFVSFRVGHLAYKED